MYPGFACFGSLALHKLGVESSIIQFELEQGNSDWPQTSISLYGEYIQPAMDSKEWSGFGNSPLSRTASVGFGVMDEMYVSKMGSDYVNAGGQLRIPTELIRKTNPMMDKAEVRVISVKCRLLVRGKEQDVSGSF
jgi:hypothetical protein